MMSVFSKMVSVFIKALILLAVTFDLITRHNYVLA